VAVGVFGCLMSADEGVGGVCGGLAERTRAPDCSLRERVEGGI
jgi:hypothetical protein